MKDFLFFTILVIVLWILVFFVVAFFFPAKAQEVKVIHKITVKTTDGGYQLGLERKAPYSNLLRTADSKPNATGASISFMTEALTEIPDSKEWQIISKFRYKSILAHIYKHESTFGRNDACRKQGGYNGFGFKESDDYIQRHGSYCYATFESLVGDVNDWIADKVKKGWSLNKINCYYVRGLAAEQCKSGYKLN